MLHKELVEKLSGSLGRSKSDINNLLDALSNVVKERCSELDSITIPRFGTIEAVKHNETVETNAETGVRTLLPPRVKIDFIMSNVLKKELNKQPKP